MKKEDALLSLIKKIDFKCQQCSACCRFEPGAVFLTEEDAKRIYDHLKIDKETFLKKYCIGIKQWAKTVVSLREKANYDCIFWDNGCTIYEARPIQCRTYPFWPFLLESEERWLLEANRCKGINQKGNLTDEEKLSLYLEEKNAFHMEI